VWVVLAEAAVTVLARVALVAAGQTPSARLAQTRTVWGLLLVWVVLAEAVVTVQARVALVAAGLVGLLMAGALSGPLARQPASTRGHEAIPACTRCRQLVKHSSWMVMMV
jgi:hypothetical protein